MERREDIEMILLAMLFRIPSHQTEPIAFVYPETERERFLFDCWDGTPKTIQTGGQHWTVMKTRDHFSIIDQDTWEKIERYSSSLEKSALRQLA